MSLSNWAAAPWVSVAALQDDPYPTYRRLRDEAPVAYVDAVQQWWVTRWDDCLAICRDAARFHASVPGSLLEETIGPNMLHADGADHRRLRVVIEPLLSPRTLRSGLADAVRDAVDELVEPIEKAGHAEFVSALAEPLAIRVLQRILGMEDIDPLDFSRYIAGIGVGVANLERDRAKQSLGEQASHEVDGAVASVLEHGAPPESVLAGLSDAERKGNIGMTDITSMVKLLLIGGVQELRDVVGSVLFALAAHPDQAEAVRTDRRLTRRALEEAMRWISPVGTITRWVPYRTDLGGSSLPAGSVVAAVIASANRDERRWSDPDCFDVHRREGTHLAFGGGPHSCAGAWFARQHGVVVVDALLDRFRELRVRDVEGAVTFAGYEFRGPTDLWLDIGA